MRWTEWADLLDYETMERAEDTKATFGRNNPTHEYKILPYGVRPELEEDSHEED